MTAKTWRIKRKPAGKGIWGFFDVIVNSKLVILVLLFILLFLINPKKQEDKEKSPVKAEIIVIMRWPDSGKQDIDLWGMGPDEIPVYYSNQKSAMLQLDRDDRGQDANTDENVEYMKSFGLPPGHYIFNIQFYSPHYDVTTVPVTISVIHGASRGKLKTIFHGTRTLTGVKEEQTAVHFEIDNEGNFIPDSISHEYIPLVARAPTSDGMD